MRFVVPSAALLKRELFTSLRRKRTFAALMFMVGTIFLLAVPVLYQIDSGFRHGYMYGTDLSPFVGMLYYAFLIMGCLVIPSLAGVSICMEKQQGSFDLLATSLIRPLGVVFAKMLNAVGVFLFIVTAAFPLLGVAFFFAGLDIDQFIVAFAIILSTAIALAAAGVLCSSVFYRSAVSLIFSYLAMLTVLGIPQWAFIGLSAAFFSGFGYSSMPREVEYLLEFALESSPIWCPLTGLSTTIAVLGGTFDQIYVAIGVFYQLLLAAVCLFLASRVQSRPPRPQKVETSRPIDDIHVLDLRRKRFPYYLLDPMKRVAEIPDGRNPMYIKEVRAGFFRKSTYRVRVFYVLAIICFIVSMLSLVEIQGRGGNEELLGVIFMLETAVVLLMVPPTVAATVTREFELGNMDMLCTTLLRPVQILLGKVYSCLMALFPVICAMVLGNTVLYFFIRTEEELAVVVGVYITLAVSVALAIAVSLLVSLFCKRQATALVGSFIANLVLFLLLPFGIVYFFEVLSRNWWASHTRTSTINWAVNLIPSPMVAQIPNIEDIGRDAEAIARWIVNMQVSIGFTAFLFLTSVAYLGRYRMRQR